MNIETVSFDKLEILRHPDGSAQTLGDGKLLRSYKALDHESGQTVVLNVLRAERPIERHTGAHLLKQARAVASLQHRHLAQVSRFGEADAAIFYVREFVEGETLRERVLREGPMEPEEALKIVRQIAEALEAMGRLDLVHAGITPSAVLLTPEGDVKLLNCGLPPAAARGESEFPHASWHCDPRFSSPEQLRDHHLDIRSDIYSLGTVLWFLLTGHCPFRGSAAEIAAGHLHTTPPFEELSGLLSSTVGLLACMLAKEAGERPRTAAKLIAAIDKCRRDLCEPEPDTRENHTGAAPICQLPIGTTSAVSRSGVSRILEPLIAAGLAAAIYLAAMQPTPSAPNVQSPNGSSAPLPHLHPELVATNVSAK